MFARPNLNLLLISATGLPSLMELNIMNEGNLSKIYKNKTVLVTGHTGFKGSWLAIWLRELGANVIGYALDPITKPNIYEACNLKDMITHVSGDIRDSGHILKTISEFRPEIIFHLAAQALVRRSYIEPKLTFDTNIGGTINVLEAIRLTRFTKAFVNITSDKCYENREWVWGYRENDPLGGHDPYSASKGCAELVFSAYLNSFFGKEMTAQKKTGMASVRAGNVIGGGDWAEDRLIPDCVRAVQSEDPIIVRNPKSIRPWQHVLEPLGGYLLIGALLYNHPDKYNGAWNFGPDDANYLPVQKVVRKFIEQWGYGQLSQTSNSNHDVHEAVLLKLCCDKAKTLLGWNSVLNIDECLDLTVEWYKEFYINNSPNNIYTVCKKQIEQYMKKGNLRSRLWLS